MALLLYGFSLISGLMALRQIPKLRNTHSQLMFYILFCTSVCLLGYQLLVDGLFLRMPHMFLVVNSFALIAIMCLYFYARWLVDVEFALARKHFLSAIGIALAYAILLIPFWQLRAAEKTLIIGEIVRMHVLYTARDPEILGMSVFKISNAYFAIVGGSTFILCFKIVFRRHSEEANRPLFYAAIFFGLCLAAALVGTIAITINSLVLIVVSGLVLSLAFTGLYLVGEMLESGEPPI